MKKKDVYTYPEGKIDLSVEPLYLSFPVLSTLQLICYQISSYGGVHGQ